MGARHAALLLAVGLMVPSTVARAECRDSAGGTFSLDVRLSPMSGIGCFTAVTVFEGSSCRPERERWAITLGCNESRRMVVSDRGRLVSLLAPRASRRNWEIVRVFEATGRQAVVRSIRLDELPGLPERARRPRMSLDASVLRIETDPPVTVPVTVLESLGRERARRPLHRP